MNKKFLAAGMAAAMAATMLPSMAFADEQPTVTLLVPEYNAGKSLKNEGSDEVIKKVQEYTGINFEIKWGDNGAYDQVLGTTLMDFDNMPMILTCGGAMNGTIVSAAEEGAFWDLSEYLNDSEKFPNLSQVNKETLKGLTVGGEVIGIPRVRELGRYGFSYRQEFKYNRLFTGDRLLRVVPKLGYNFKRKEFYWSINSDFDYWPRKRAALHVSVGNGNRIYSSDVLEDLKAIPDSIFDFDQIHLDYFKDLYLHIRHSWEVVNGLTLDVGLSLHRRTEVERSKFVLVYPDGPSVMSTAMPPLYPGFDPSVLKKFRHSYNSFAPRVRVTWTPGQYYYMSGDRKINLYSKYPTVSVDWERGLSGIMHSTGKYERIEVDFQHNIPLGLMRDIYYRLGWGAFTNQKELYFVDFANLARSNLPVGWNDEIGGVFQLLDGRWYNSSREYVRGHFTYEAPFLLLRHLKKYTQYVLNERLYLNALVVPHLNPYLEVGYGIGTHVFDFGVFASFANWKYQEMGVKFTFELFNR